MSLIEEALRRVKDPIASQAPPATTAKPTSPAAAHSWSAQPAPIAGARSTDALRPVVLGIFLAALAAGIAAALWWGRTTPSATTGSTGGSTGNSLTAPRLSPTKAPGSSATAASTDTLVLSGVVIGDGEPYAVINGTIVGLGEEIAGVTLESVEEGAASLRRRNGEPITLRVPR